MKILDSTSNSFGGVMVAPEALDPDAGAFRASLVESLRVWKEESCRVAWLEIPTGKSQLIPEAVGEGFSFHHSGDDYLMLTLQLEEGAFIPAHASHYIGVGGVTLNSRGGLLVVSEKYRRVSPNSPPRYKLPGGALHEGEHLVEGVVREVFEETGVRTEFDALVCFRHWHGYRYGKSDIYFVCRLHPLSEKISIQEEEIAESLWMPVADYLGSESVSDFNKRIVKATMESPGVVPSPIAGYGDPDKYEFFMPADDELPPE